MSRIGPLYVILLGTVALGALFMATIPPGYGPDEPSHFGYVRYVAEGRGFPVLGRETDPAGPFYEAHQPPLYYLLAAPFYRIGRAAAGGRGAWWGVRAFTLLCGVGTVALTYLLILRLSPGEPVLASMAAMFAGWLPSQAALFAVASNDPLTELGFTGAFYLLARHLLDRDEGRNGGPWYALGAGVAAGLTFLTKASGLLVLLVPPFVLVARDLPGTLGKKRPADPGKDGTAAPPAARVHPALLFLLGALVCLPWLLRNQAVYGDPLGWRAFVRYFLDVKGSPTPERLAQLMGVPYSPGWYWLGQVLPWGFRDSLGMWLFRQRVGLPDACYYLWGALWVGALAGCGRFAVREWRARSLGWRSTVAAMLLTLALLFAAYLRLNAVFYWAQSRYVFPGAAALALIWSVGLTRLVPERSRAGVAWGTGGLLFLLSLFAGYAVLGGYFDSLLSRPPA